MTDQAKSAAEQIKEIAREMDRERTSTIAHEHLARALHSIAAELERAQGLRDVERERDELRERCSALEHTLETEQRGRSGPPGWHWDKELVAWERTDAVKAEGQRFLERAYGKWIPLEDVKASLAKSAKPEPALTVSPDGTLSGSLPCGHGVNNIGITAENTRWCVGCVTGIANLAEEGALPVPEDTQSCSARDPINGALCNRLAGHTGFHDAGNLVGQRTWRDAEPSAAPVEAEEPLWLDDDTADADWTGWTCTACGLQGQPERLPFCSDKQCPCAVEACPRCGAADPGGRMAHRLRALARELAEARREIELSHGRETRGSEAFASVLERAEAAERSLEEASIGPAHRYSTGRDLWVQLMQWHDEAQGEKLAAMEAYRERDELRERVAELEGEVTHLNTCLDEEGVQAGWNRTLELLGHTAQERDSLRSQLTAAESRAREAEERVEAAYRDGHFDGWMTTANENHMDQASEARLNWEASDTRAALSAEPGERGEERR